MLQLVNSQTVLKCLLVTIALIICSCTRNQTEKRLEHINTMINADKLDSAYNELLHINKLKLNNADEAYYNLLYMQTAYRLYKPISSDSIINKSLEYFSRQGNKEKLAIAYLYKGMIELTLGKIGEAIVNLKTAESLSMNIRDDNLSHKVYNGLVTFNYATANYDLALKNARNELLYSEKSGNKGWIAYAYNHLSCIYDKIGIKDSVFFYIKKVIPLIQFVPKEAQSYHLSNIGLYYFHNGDSILAKRYLMKSYAVNPICETSNILAQLYYNEGNKAMAMNLLNKALRTNNLGDQVKTKETMFELLYADKQYKAAGKISSQIKILKDSIERQQQTEKVQELQLSYDFQKEKNNSNRKEAITLTAASLLAILSIILFFYFRYHTKQMNQNTKQKINNYKQIIESLETSGKDVTKEVAQLKQKLSHAEAKETEILARGYKLYDNIIKGETTISWTKEDFFCFIEYYKVVNSRFFIQLEEGYTNLSAGNKFLLILQDMHFDNETICHILGFSAGALRAARFRIKNKMKE